MATIGFLEMGKKESKGPKSLYDLFKKFKKRSKLKRDRIVASLRKVDGGTRLSADDATWFRRMSAISLSDVISVDPYARSLAGLRLKHFDGPVDALISDELAVMRGQLDRAVLLKLMEYGLLEPFFSVRQSSDDAEPYSLKWMFEIHADLAALEKTIREWQWTCVDNNFFLFITTYRLWLNLSNAVVNFNVTLTLSRYLAQVAIAYGMNAEALLITDRLLVTYGYWQEKNGPSAETHIRTAEAWTLRGVAYGRLMELNEAEQLFDSAERAIEYALEGSKDVDVAGTAAILRRTVLRERVRMYANVGLDQLSYVWSDLPEWMPVTIQSQGGSWESFGKNVSSLIEACRQNPRTALPIDWDAAARGLLFTASEKSDTLDEAFALSQESDAALIRLKEKDELDIHSSVLTENSLDTTKILLCCAKGDFGAAETIFTTYDERIRPSDRRITLRQWQGVRIVLRRRYTLNLSRLKRSSQPGVK